MGIFPFASCPCPCWPQPSSTHPNSSTQHQDQSNHSGSEEPDERTPLITNPPQITHSPHLPIIDTAQQQADEAAANKIVNQTVRCLVDVYSQAPFSHLRIQEPHKPADSIQHHTPDGSSSTWRAYDPPICPPISSQGCTLILGFDEVPSTPDSQCTPKHDGHNPKANHQRSFHSLKTIVNHNQSSRQNGTINQESLPPQANPTDSNLSQLSSSSSCASSSQHSSTPSQPASDESETTPQHSRQNSIAPTSCSTQFNSINSFQTARDDTNSEPDHLPDYLNQSLPQLDHPNPLDRPVEKPDLVKNLWNHHHHQSSSSSSGLPINPTHLPESHNSLDDSSLHHHSEHDSSDFLTDDPKKLAEMISNGFQLKDPGPIIVEL